MSPFQKRQKKIAIVANTTWNIYNFRLNILKALTNNGFQVVVIAPKDQYLFYQSQFPKVQHRNLKNLNRKGTRLLEDWKLIRELKKIYKEERPDVVLHYTIKPNIYGSLAAQATQIPAISVVTGLGYAYLHNGLLYKFVEQLYKRALRKNRYVVFENQDDRLLFLERGIIRSKQGISVKGCGVNVKSFKPATKNGQLEEQLTFTYIGRLLKDKGIYEFIEAARHLKQQNKPYRFQLVGNIDTGNPAAINQRELNQWQKEGIVDYLGFQDDVRPIIAHSDCIVLPSYREAIARSITEAMAMEKPVIATNTAGCKEAIDHGEQGFLVPVQSPKALEDAMNNMANLTKEERQQMGKAGRKKVLTHFDDQKIAQQILRLIQDVVGN